MSFLVLFCFFLIISLFSQKSLQTCLSASQSRWMQLDKGTAFPGTSAELFGGHLTLLCSEKEGHCSSDECIGTPASHEVRLVLIKGRRHLVFPLLYLIFAFACGLVCVYENCM